MKLSISSDKMQGTDVSMTLDEIIKKKRTQKKGDSQQKRGGGAGRGGAAPKGKLQGTKAGGVTKQKNRGQGGQRRGMTRGRGGFGNQGNLRNQMNLGGRQQQQQQQQQQRSGKLTITNLDFGVSDGDIRELFNEFGAIKTAAIHYGSNGVSLGAAHVHFANFNSASRALSRYNGVHLDGRPMRIAFKDGMVAPNPMQRGATRGGGMRGRGQFRNIGQRVGGGRQQQQGQKQQQQGQKQKQGQRGRGGAKGRGGRGAKTKTEPPTVEQLNEQLDAYLNEASK